MNAENGLHWSLITDTDSPRLAVTPGEWDASEMILMMRTDLHRTKGFVSILGTMCDCGTVGVIPGLIPPRLPVARLDWLTSFSAARVFRRTSFRRAGW